MEKHRASNLELLRILLICAVPIYHCISYTGVFYTEYVQGGILSFVLSAEGAIGADYAFIGLSAYFLQKKSVNVPHKFLSTLFLALTILIPKLIVVFSCFGRIPYGNLTWDYFIKGAWWFVWGYLILLLLHRGYNKMLEKISTGLLTLLVAGLAVLMLFIEYRYYDNMLSDVVAFAFTYFLIALIERSPLEKAGVKTWLELVLIFAVLIYALCARVRSCGLYPDADSAFPPILRICGKYSLLNAGLGISVFYLFKKIRMPELPWINAWAKSVFFVFLTHETILALLWRLGILNFRLRYAQPWVRGVKLLAYLALCLLVGWILEKIYHRWIAPVYEKAIRKLLKEDS